MFKLSNHKIEFMTDKIKILIFKISDWLNWNRKKSIL